MWLVSVVIQFETTQTAEMHEPAIVNPSEMSATTFARINHASGAGRGRFGSIHRRNRKLREPLQVRDLLTHGGQRVAVGVSEQVVAFVIAVRCRP